MQLGMKRYEVDIRLYCDKEQKTLFKFIPWYAWAWCLPMAKLIAHLEAAEQIRKNKAFAITYTCEVLLARKKLT